jgi:tetratricopeptide (TPR) repeat protein
METHPHVHRRVPREVFAHVIQESLDHEKKADELQRLGKLDLAAREYEKSLELEEKCLGKDHPVVRAFRHKLELPSTPETSWKRTAHRPAAEALAESLHHEREGDYLHKLGYNDLAKHEYDMALKIEKHVVGPDHPMVTSLEQKVILEMNE